MKRSSMTALITVASAGLLAYASLSSPSAEAQSGSRYQGGSGRYQARSGQSKPSFESRFWNWLQASRYRNWAPAPGQSGDFYPGQSPHGAYLKMYLNRVAAGNPDAPPPGSIIIKENYGKDKQTLAAVTVMYRSTKKYDPEHNDWYWVKYNADGTVARTPADKGNRPIAGRVQSCIDCHGGAGGDDFAFFNDK